MTADMQRKLTTILAADAAGYSREMAADEARALAALRSSRGVFSKAIERHRGRIANTAGDGLIAEFPSVVEAVQCAIEVQRDLGQDATGGLPFRIGIHLGDVFVDGDDLLGEGVNLAARLQSMADPGGILVSQQVYDQVHAKLSVGFDYLGERRPRNYSENIAVYRVTGGKKPGWFGAETPVRPAPKHRKPPVPGSHPGTARGIIRQAQVYGVVWLALLAVDLVTGPPLWVHWIAIPIAAYLGWRAAPLVQDRWLDRQLLRAAVVIVVLAAINAATWTGYPWAMWPAGALVVVLALLRIRRRDR